MINPEVYNDRALMNDWYNYRTHNDVSPELYQTMVDFDKGMIGIGDGVKEMVRTNWYNIMDENLKIYIAKEKGRLAGEKVSNAIITLIRTVVKWIKRALVTCMLVAAGAAVYSHPHVYEEPKSTQAVYHLDGEGVLDKSYEYVIVEAQVEAPVPEHKPNR